MNEYVFACNGKSRIVCMDAVNLYDAAHNETEISKYSVGDVFTISDSKGRCMTYRKLSDGNLFLEDIHGMYK